MFRRGKRGNTGGQITVFVLLAIVIMLAFMFLLFMKIMVEKERYAVMATRQVQDYISQNSLSIYVTNCIDSVTTEALIRASLQGGVINFTNKIAGRDYVPYYALEYNRTVNISIAIVPNDNCSVVRRYPWEYPYPEAKLYPTYILNAIYNNDSLSCKYSGDIYDYYSGFFGRNQLTKLCDWNGSNKIGATNTSFGVRTCEVGTYTNSRVKSVQEDMEQFIESEIRKCIDFNEVLKNTPSNITQAGAPQASVIFGDNGFAVKLQYPFIVTVRGRQPIKTFYDFGIERPARFKELYDYAYFSARTDAQEAGFNMLEEKLANSDMARSYKGYAVKRIKSIDVNQTDIIRMIDNGTLIDGKPMILQFAIKNRRPALEYINEYSGLLGVDLVLQENDSIIITPQGYDPDDDELVYDYRLWKEDYDEAYNMSNPSCVTNIPSIQYMKDHCMIRITSQPKNFTNSTEFKATGKNARYFPNSSDRGYHELNVSIKEVGRQELMDWQVVRIFVFDKPTSNITGNNLYPNIGDRYASVEDPYILNGSNSLVGLSGAIPGFNNNFSTFIWNDSLGEFYKEVPITTDRNKTLYLPIDVNGSTTDNIMIIKKYVFNRTGWRNISLVVNTFLGLSDFSEYEIEVMQCLPHRNPANPSYPYNSNPYDNNDAYLANHTCCADTYTVRGAGSSCYTDTSYGANVSFNNLANDFWTRQPLPPPNAKSVTFYYGAGRADNDIFRRTFARNCDGTRGNICSGNANEARTVIETCNDNNYGTGGENRCSGPPFQGNNFIVSDNPLSCVDYSSGTTFELRQKRDLGVAVLLTDYYCNNTFSCSSSPGTNRYNTGGPVSCKGSCGNGGCTTAVSCTCDYDDCTADYYCDGLSWGLNRPTTERVCTFGNQRVLDLCNNCQRAMFESNICSSEGADCSADPLCNNVAFNGAAIGNNYQWCNNQCILMTCAGNFAYQEGGSCYTSCTVDAQCADGYTCCTAQMIANHECINEGSCFVYVPT